MSQLPFFVIVPLAAGFFIPVFGKKIKPLGGAVSVAATAALLILSANDAYLLFGSGRMLVCNVSGWQAPFGIPLVADGLTCFMLVIVNTTAFLVSLYATEYVKRYTDPWKFFSLFMLMVAGMNGVLISGDLFNLYVFLEVAAVAAYALVAFGAEAEELEAAFKYAVMGAVGSSFIVLGIAFVYSSASTLNMADISTTLSGTAASRIPALFASVLFLMGFGLKAALMPFHAWLPDAHSSAPTPISAMLSGLLIKVLGVYVIIRIFFNVFGMSEKLSMILISLAVLSMVAASLMAFGQTDLKRLLAYSTISQVGYIMLGLGVGTPLAIMGALFHLFSHSISKALLFLSAGAVEDIGGTRDLNKMPGVLARSRVTGYTNLIGSMSVCGIPPLSGFWSKIIIIFACIQADRPMLAFTAAAVGMLTIGYYFKAVTPALFGAAGSSDKAAGKKKLPPMLVLPLVALAFLAVFGILLLVPGIGRQFLGDAIAALIRGKEYASVLAECVR